MGWMNVFFSFYGRINRAKYWIAVIVYSLLWMMVGIGMVGSLAKIDPNDPLGLASMGFAWLGLIMLVTIITGISALAIGVKRLHDRDKKGWWILLFWILPGLLDSISMSMGRTPVGMILSFAGLVLLIWGFIELGFLRGTSGPNRFGPDPLTAMLPGQPVYPRA